MTERDEDLSKEPAGYAAGWNLFNIKPFTNPPESIAAIIYVIAIIAVVSVSISGIYGLFQLIIPIWITDSESKIISTQNITGDLRDRLIVVGAILSTPFLIWRLTVSHWSARAAQQQALIARDTARNTLFSKAIEQLGTVRELRKIISKILPDMSEESQSVVETVANIEVRLGAIYSLEKLAREDIALHWPIMETLCAYIRENSGSPRPTPKPAPMPGAKSSSAPNQANTGTESLAETGLRVDIQAAITVLGRRSRVQQLYEASQRDKSVTRAKKQAWRLDLTKCNLNTANFQGLDFNMARFDSSSLISADFSAAKLSSCSLMECDCTGAVFDESDMRRANLSRSVLTGASLKRTDLSGSILNRTSLREAYLLNANMQGVQLQGVFLYAVNFYRAKLDDSLFMNANMTHATNISQGQLESIWADASTLLPAGCNRPTNFRWLATNANQGAQDEWLSKALEALSNRRRQSDL